jgi:hypothetical protein
MYLSQNPFDKESKEKAHYNTDPTLPPCLDKKKKAWKAISTNILVILYYFLLTSSSHIAFSSQKLTWRL